MKIAISTDGRGLTAQLVGLVPASWLTAAPGNKGLAATALAGSMLHGPAPGPDLYAVQAVPDSARARLVYWSGLLCKGFFNVGNKILVFGNNIAGVAFDGLASTVDQILVKVPFR